jgi:hypothetical protein
MDYFPTRDCLIAFTADVDGEARVWTGQLLLDVFDAPTGLVQSAAPIHGSMPTPYVNQDAFGSVGDVGFFNYHLAGYFGVAFNVLEDPFTSSRRVYFGLQGTSCSVDEDGGGCPSPCPVCPIASSSCPMKGMTYGVGAGAGLASYQPTVVGAGTANSCP